MAGKLAPSLTSHQQIARGWPIVSHPSHPVLSRIGRQDPQAGSTGSTGTQFRQRTSARLVYVGLRRVYHKVVVSDRLRRLVRTQLDQGGVELDEVRRAQL